MDVFDTVLCAIGRDADVSGLDLKTVGVNVNSKNSKLICSNEQTNVPHIYAIGDIVQGAPELTPTAIMVNALLLVVFLESQINN